MMGAVERVARLVSSGLERWRRRSFLEAGSPAENSGVTIPTACPLGRVLSAADLQLVDVGARGGAIHQLRVLAPFAHYFACEPDRAEAATLPAQLRAVAPWRDITVIPEALSSTEGVQVLHVTVQPGLSSLLRPNPAVVRRYYSGSEFDVRATVRVPAIALDQAADRYGFRNACFLKLDTQGTELAILRSGARLLEESVVCLYLEVEFHPFYTEQPLFADVDQYLRSLGFGLMDLERTLLRRSSYRPDVYSRREIVWAHALYLRLAGAWLDREDATLQRLSRLLAMALAFEHYDLVLEMVSVGPFATRLRAQFGDGLAADLDALVRRRTRELERLARRGPPPIDLKGFVHRDRKLPW